jgi:hypothetical protein
MSISLQDIASQADQVRHDNRRAHERVAGRVVIRIGTKRAVNKGLVHNLSLGGIGVYTRCVYPPGTVVAVAVDTEAGTAEAGTAAAGTAGSDTAGSGAAGAVPGAELALAGEVRWTRIVSGNPPDAVYEMGIRLIEPPKEYGRFFADVAERSSRRPTSHAPNFTAGSAVPSANADWHDVASDAPAPADDERRIDPRFDLAVPVTFVEPPDVASTLTRNIAGGGAFVVGATSLEVGMVAVIDVRLPEIPEPVRALGRVAHVRPSCGPGDPGGVGLRFLRFYAGSEERLITYLDGLEKSLGVTQVHIVRGVDLPRD